MKTNEQLQQAIIDWTQTHIETVNDVEMLRRIVLRTTHMLVRNSNRNQLIAMLAALTMPIADLDNFDNLPESEQFELLMQYGGMKE
jgi:hypothetical protein